jgi:hypothetical protein
MIQPKDLYRKLAMLLAEIDKGRDKEDYLLSVLATLENSFIRDLHITDGRLYVEDHERFLPMNVVDGWKQVRVAEIERYRHSGVELKRWNHVDALGSSNIREASGP